MSDFIRVGGVQRLQDGEFIVQVSFLFTTYLDLQFPLLPFDAFTKKFILDQY